MSRLTIRLLGPPAIALGGRAVGFDTRKATALVAYLAERGRPVRRATLAALLWPDYVPARAAANLRRTLWSIQRVFGPQRLATTADELALVRGAELYVDLDRFRTLQALCRAHGHAADADCADCVARLVEAAQLVRGAFLEGFSLPDSADWDDWQALQAAELRRAYADVLRTLAEGSLAAHDLPRALDFALRWAELDPLHEPSQRRLMLLLAWNEQPVEALQRYRALERLLARELGVAPDRETRELYATIRARQTLPPLVFAEAALASTRSPSIPAARPAVADDMPADELASFVGRRNELEQLDASLRAALTGNGRIVFVVGEAGSGKSALLAAFARHAVGGNGELVAVDGTCNAYAGIGDPYLPFRQILEQLTGEAALGRQGDRQPASDPRLRQVVLTAARALVREGQDLLGAVVPAPALLARLRPVADRRDAWYEQLERAAVQDRLLDPTLRQQSLLDQYARVLEAVARQHPLVLLVDDLQWADVSSINLLWHLGRSIPGQRMLLVGAYRPADVALGRAGARHPLAQVVNELQRVHGQPALDLDAAAGRAFIDDVLDQQPNHLDERFRETLYRQTGGQALFTLELLRGMRERGDLLTDNRGRLMARDSLDWSSVPVRVEAVIGERVGRLAPPDRELLRAASTEGEEFGAEVVARVLGADAMEIRRRLSTVLDREHQLVRAVGIRAHGRARVACYRFRHFLIQRSLYNSLDDAERSRYHEGVGGTLEAMYGAHCAPIAVQLAHHYEHAGLLEPAIAFLHQAGDHAVRSLADDEALAQFRRALELLARLPESTARNRQELGLQIGLSTVLQMTVGYPAGEVEAVVERALALGRALGNPPEAVALLGRSAHMRVTLGDHRKARTIADELLGLALQGDDATLILEAFTVQGITACLLGEIADAQTWLDKAVAVYDRERDRRLTYTYGIEPGAHIGVYAAFTHWFAGEADLAAVQHEATLAQAHAGDHPHTLALALAFGAVFQSLRRDVAATLQLTAEAIAVSEQHKFPLMCGLAQAVRGWALSLSGAPEDGLALFSAAIEAARLTRVQLFIPYLTGLQAEIQQHLGQSEAALATIAQAITYAERNEERGFLPAMERIQRHLWARARAVRTGGGDPSLVW